MREVERREDFVEASRQRAGGALRVQTETGVAHSMHDRERNRMEL